MNKKLKLKKVTVANLDSSAMNRVKAGGSDDGRCEADEYTLQKWLSFYTHCANGSCDTACVHGSCFMACTPSELCPTVEPVAL
jgi:hypothetical protein